MPDVASGRWIFLSDVHLDVVPDRRDGAGALASFLCELGRETRPETTLVLLGDLFELLAPARRDETAGRERLGAVLDANPDVVAALRDCVAARVTVAVVPGNHDIDLVRPRLAGLLVDRLTAGHGGRVDVHPWRYAVPGLLYAEHGNQHHDLNRFPHSPAPYSRRRPTEMFVPPMARTVDGERPWRNGATVLTALAASWWAESSLARRPTGAHTRCQPDPSVGPASLDPELVRQLDQRSRVRLGRTARRLVTARARQVVHAPGAATDGYLIEAADHVAGVCAGLGHHFPFLVFGHTHVARDLTLPDGSTRYLNCGTWSDHVKPADPTTADPGAFPYVEIDGTGGGRAALRWWRPPEHRSAHRSIPSTPWRTPWITT